MRVDTLSELGHTCDARASNRFVCVTVCCSVLQCVAVCVAVSCISGTRGMSAPLVAIRYEVIKNEMKIKK